MMMVQTNKILADGRWRGYHGIGRFATEVLSRLKNADIIEDGPHPFSLKNMIWQNRYLAQKNNYQIFYNPGFNPVWSSTLPYVLTIHDLIPIKVKNERYDFLKKSFFKLFIQPAAKKAFKIITVSEYSKKEIQEWAGLASSQVVVASCGISSHFSQEGLRYEPGFPYLLHVGSTRGHKNFARLLIAFSQANMESSVKLICTGKLSDKMMSLISHLRLQDRILSHTNLSEEQLASYYRGALGVVFPSLYEGFGLSIVEGMASGVPVLTSNVTSMPEIAGNAAILIDPLNIDSISQGISQLVENSALRNQLIHQGLERAKLFSWDRTAQVIQHVLDSPIK